MYLYTSCVECYRHLRKEIEEKKVGPKALPFSLGGHYE